jgi:hypothetical protein
VVFCRRHIAEPEAQLAGLQIRPESRRLQIQSPADRRLGFIGPSIGEQRGSQERVGGRVRRVSRDRSVEGIDRLAETFV